MPLQRAVKTGGDFLDLKELCAESGGTVLAVFRVREFQPAENATGFVGQNVPVIADVLICSGPRVGEVHEGERFIGAITATLRGVKNPNAQKNVPVLPPVNEVGAEIATRMKVLNPGKANAGVVGDTPSDVEYAEIERIYADGAAWTAAQTTVPAQAANGMAAAGAPAKPF